MDRKELEAKVLELVGISYDTDAAKLSMETSFKEDLQGASIQMVALVAEQDRVALDAVRTPIGCYDNR